MNLEIPKKVKQLFIDFLNDANNVISIPKGHGMLFTFWDHFDLKRIRKYSEKGPDIMSIPVRVRRRFNF